MSEIAFLVSGEKMFKKIKKYTHHNKDYMYNPFKYFTFL